MFGKIIKDGDLDIEIVDSPRDVKMKGGVIGVFIMVGGKWTFRSKKDYHFRGDELVGVPLDANVMRFIASKLDELNGVS